MISELLQSVASRALSIGTADRDSSGSNPSGAATTAKKSPTEAGDSLDLVSASQLSEIMQDYDLNSITPRETKELAERLYHEAGAIELSEYMTLAFQPEVDDPDTWTELTGRQPQPDAPVDLIGKLQEMLKQQRNDRANPETIQNSEKLVQLMHSLSVLSDAF